MSAAGKPTEATSGTLRSRTRRAQTEHVGRQLAAVADRLCHEFAPDGGAAAAAVRAQVHRSRAEFGSPRVIAYLPTLVERAVRSRLTASHRQQPSMS